MSSNYTRSVALPVTAGVVAFAGSKLLYGSIDLNTPYGKYDLAMVMGLAGAIGLGLSELTHDMIFKTIHVSERLANPATIAVNTGINFGAQLTLMQMLNESSFTEIDKAKLLAESVGVVIASDYLYSNFVGPMILGDNSHSTYSS